MERLDAVRAIARIVIEFEYGDLIKEGRQIRFSSIMLVVNQVSKISLLLGPLEYEKPGLVPSFDKSGHIWGRIGRLRFHGPLKYKAFFEMKVLFWTKIS